MRKRKKEKERERKRKKEKTIVDLETKIVSKNIIFLEVLYLIKLLRKKPIIKIC